MGTLYIAPSSLWENTYVESFNSRLADELLNVESFGSLRETQVLVEAYRRQYNHQRPHSSLGYATPGVVRRRLFFGYGFGGTYAKRERTCV